MAKLPVLFTPTGRISIVIELEDQKPMIIDVDDNEVVKKIFRLILDTSAPDFSVNAYNKKTGRRAKKLLTGR